MKCILCDAKMLQGGIVTQGVSAIWIPQIEFQKKGIKKLIYKNGKNIGSSDVVLGQTKISNAYFCSNCNKIIGIFDVNDKLSWES